MIDEIFMLPLLFVGMIGIIIISVEFLWHGEED